jgi:hypothetical protein
MPLILNGPYILWPSSKTQEKFINEKRFIPKNIIYTRFQVYSGEIFLAALRYKKGISGLARSKIRPNFVVMFNIKYI